MNLVIDVGNTLLKISVFDESKSVYKNTLKTALFLEELQNVATKYPKITHAILSSVARIDQKHLNSIQEQYTVLVLDHATKMPFKNLYATPKTLGVDRLALAAAAVDQFPKQDTLIIDAGTCITYDFKNSKEEYLGGAISPGIQLRYQSIHQYTSNLPELTKEIPESYIGKTTNEAIHSGVVHGVFYEIEGVITEYCNTYPDLTVILTGGDVHFLSKRLKNTIFATSNFLLEGLNYILAFNNTQ